MTLPKDPSDSNSYDLNFLHLACIFSVPVGLPGVFIGRMLFSEYGVGTTVGSIFTGNLILWLTGMGMVSMTYQKRSNAIENAKKYVGRAGSFLFALILVLVFFNWFVLIIHASMRVLEGLIHKENWENLVFVRIGAGIGLLTALVSIGGMRVIKYLSFLGLIPLIIYHIYGAFVSENHPLVLSSIGLNFRAMMAATLVLFPAFLNLPTVYRHARSRFDSYLSLSLIFIFVTFFEISFIWMPFGDDYESRYLGSNLNVFVFFTFLYILFKLVSSNALNIYFASACWEFFFPKFEGAKGYAIIGMLGTVIYTFVQIGQPIRYFQTLSTCYLICLGAVLFIAFLIEELVHHRPRILEKWVNILSWTAGSIVSTISVYFFPDEGITACLTGLLVSSLFFLFVMYLEETIWAIRTILLKKG